MMRIGPIMTSLVSAAQSHDYSKELADDSIQSASSDETLRDDDLNLPEIKRSRLERLRQLAISVLLAVLPSPLLSLSGYQSPSSTRGGESDFGSTTYLLGLRGMASFFVYLEHFAMRSHDDMLREYSHPTFMQLPGIRLAYAGPAWVKMFFILSGFALSVRPIEIIYERDWERLSRTMASAFFRRGFRIFIPPIVASLFVLVAVRLDLFRSSNEYTASLGLGYPIYRASLAAQVADLVDYLLGRLIYPWGWLKPLHNITRPVYVTTFWTIPREFYASLQIFALLIALSRVKPTARIFTVASLALYAGWANRGDLGCFLVGMLFAEFHIRKKLLSGTATTESRLNKTTITSTNCTNITTTTMSKSLLTKIISTGAWTVVLGAGIWMASIPITKGNYGSSTPGYRTIATVIPLNESVMSIGMALLFWGIYKLPLVQRFFSSAAMCYLGNISFSLYLIHWPILAGGGWNVVPLVQKKLTPGHDEVGFVLAFVVATQLMLWASDLYWRVVDLGSIRFAKGLERQLFVE